GSLLKRITVSSGAGARIDIEVASLSDYSTFTLSDPERIVIDLHSAGSIAKPATRDVARGASKVEVNPRSTPAISKSETRDEQPRTKRMTAADRNPMMVLPEISEPIVPTGSVAPSSASD